MNIKRMRKNVLTEALKNITAKLLEAEVNIEILEQKMSLNPVPENTEFKIGKWKGTVRELCMLDQVKQTEVMGDATEEQMMAVEKFKTDDATFINLANAMNESKRMQEALTMSRDIVLGKLND